MASLRRCLPPLRALGSAARQRNSASSWTTHRLGSAENTTTALTPGGSQGRYTSPTGDGLLNWLHTHPEPCCNAGAPHCPHVTHTAPRPACGRTWLRPAARPGCGSQQGGGEGASVPELGMPDVGAESFLQLEPVPVGCRSLVGHSGLHRRRGGEPRRARLTIVRGLGHASASCVRRLLQGDQFGVQFDCHQLRIRPTPDKSPRGRAPALPAVIQPSRLAANAAAVVTNLIACAESTGGQPPEGARGHSHSALWPSYRWSRGSAAYVPSPSGASVSSKRWDRLPTRRITTLPGARVVS